MSRVSWRITSIARFACRIWISSSMKSSFACKVRSRPANSRRAVPSSALAREFLDRRDRVRGGVGLGKAWTNKQEEQRDDAEAEPTHGCLLIEMPPGKDPVTTLAEMRPKWDAAEWPALTKC